MNNAAVAKFNMIEQQIRPWEVLDPKVLSVLMGLDRADFVEERYKGLAYADCQIPLANQSRMSPPIVEGRLLQALGINKEDSILEVGSGSGYLSACLASLGKQVLSLDINTENLEFARQNTTQAGLHNIEFREANGLEFNSDDSFDVIAVSASVSEAPDNLKLALKPGGRLFIIAGQSPVMQALLFTRIGGQEWSCESLFETDLPCLQV